MGSLAETARYVCLLPVNPTQRQTQEKVGAEGTSISVEEQKCQLKMNRDCYLMVMFSLIGEEVEVKRKPDKTNWP